jgi:hypothetical protein
MGPCRVQCDLRLLPRGSAASLSIHKGQYPVRLGELRVYFERFEEPGNGRSGLMGALSPRGTAKSRFAEEIQRITTKSG